MTPSPERAKRNPESADYASNPMAGARFLVYYRMKPMVARDVI